MRVSSSICELQMGEYLSCHFGDGVDIFTRVPSGDIVFLHSTRHNPCKQPDVRLSGTLLPDMNKLMELYDAKLRSDTY